jgi:hypothetical protein
MASRTPGRACVFLRLPAMAVATRTVSDVCRAAKAAARGLAQVDSA